MPNVKEVIQKLHEQVDGTVNEAVSFSSVDRGVNDFHSFVKGNMNDFFSTKWSKPFSYHVFLADMTASMARMLEKSGDTSAALLLKKASENIAKLGEAYRHTDIW